MSNHLLVNPRSLFFSRPQRLAGLVVVLLALTLAGCANGDFDATLAAPLPTLAGEVAQADPVVASPFPTETPSPTLEPSATATLTPEPTLTPTVTPTPGPVVLAGAGDISICGQEGDDQTAALLGMIEPDGIFTAGDNTNGEGTWEEYIHCFDASWGQYRHLIRPAPGNHDYYTDEDGASYFDYFGEAAGERGKGYYSYDLGEWHIVVMNSNCLNIDGCESDSPQVEWLRQDLAASDKQCTLAYWHHPRWTSGLAGNTFWIDAFWQVLYEHGAEVVLSGHDHDYERFAPQNPAGEADPEGGIRQFVIGTGGASQRGFNAPQPNSEIRNSGDFGILKFELYPDRYRWTFIPVVGGAFTDSGETLCH